VAEVNRESVERLRSRGIPAVSGDASEAEVLIQAHVAQAQLIVVATPDTVKVRKIVDIARMLNPKIAAAAHPQRRGSGVTPAGEPGSRLHGRARAGAGHDAGCAGPNDCRREAGSDLRSGARPWTWYRAVPVPRTRT
jgi:hypothetical protein